MFFEFEFVENIQVILNRFQNVKCGELDKEQCESVVLARLITLDYLDWMLPYVFGTCMLYRYMVACVKCCGSRIEVSTYGTYQDFVLFIRRLYG